MAHEDDNKIPALLPGGVLSIEKGGGDLIVSTGTGWAMANPVHDIQGVIDRARSCDRKDLKILNEHLSVLAYYIARSDDPQVGIMLDIFQELALIRKKLTFIENF